MVDERLWRGDGPERRGYRELAARGVRTVVDLRAERDLDVPEELLEELDIERVHIPIRDGQTPTRAQVEQSLEVMRTTDHRVYLHCGAGLGRTGVMAAAYLAATGQAGPWEALRRNLAIGPASLEQIVYATSLERGGDLARQTREGGRGCEPAVRRSSPHLACHERALSLCRRRPWALPQVMEPPQLHLASPAVNHRWPADSPDTSPDLS